MWPAVAGQLPMLVVMPSSRRVVPALGVTVPDVDALACPRCTSTDVRDLGGYGECVECGHGWSL